MLPNQMLEEVVFPVTRMPTIIDLAYPPFQMAMSFILMTNPVRPPSERLRFFASVISTSKRLKVLMDVFDPVLEDRRS